MSNDELRIGDAEREQAAQILHAQVGAGRIDLAEFEHRVDAVYQAQTRGELAVPLADLAERKQARAVPVSAGPPRFLLAAVWGQWLVTAVICTVIWAVTSLAAGQPLYFWPMWVAGPWGAMLAVTGGRGCHRALTTSHTQ